MREHFGYRKQVSGSKRLRRANGSKNVKKRTAQNDKDSGEASATWRPREESERPWVASRTAPGLGERSWMGCVKEAHSLSHNRRGSAPRWPPAEDHKV
ncbi:hypothetical protein NDU88_006339 [Pleurodeles waltl]|uniref:Uncharacterized protein n=1 Tax=Pleurodeles waltl TaxID=8319 RepID=A0AAV7LQK5_PLEWA|nr:hypothetical protein NDU88_006339 [Pleurodeles waltl]